jgi:uncharacterized protein YukE
MGVEDPTGGYGNYRDAARDIEQSVKDGMSEAEKRLKEAQGEIQAAGDELRKAEQDLTTGFAQRHPQVGLLLSTAAQAQDRLQDLMAALDDAHARATALAETVWDGVPGPRERL